ncbi:L-carnitine dehydratase/bile acid-inducible protein F (plasmid) [Dinoroseobacter shibae DFL 12 = DSM 16493]|jgi:crotonobetainyl-CoA:carnitine CoA-transferase CaiB-like acyl-CoA transferase|uniref:L-carnitine dehydratase/bile acid-inducible protein F n=1 Tax=Dinoroseobacter shibae (strain DSM 16493 / NCIMB 14021 / DFL 12) TaxID=398580 RepID=A8LSZ8_DINSH|nr:CoA transferase [Dinoroseobacter shibae]ABV95365.1 L-carnitine dehydratase/bile acid-inducible protein F [Dinoroseobacter shibae DFL 12 = DSM 16493]URF48741.1 CoA transferase [Dinoroseobacter shibae]URF53053.1 CoA transferase [Dinoroseobacter shibae]
MQNRPLSHVRVLDFGHYLAGPLVGMMLADLGADVIRIDPPAGPRWKDPAFDMLSRGKRALTLDLKTASGRDTALDLVRRADVVIENFRPGVMERLGLGQDALRQANADIVSLSLPGFASTDPELGRLAAWEAVVAARTGQYTDMGLNRRLMGINPSFTPLGLASAYGAAFGAMSVLFALGARSRMGGDHIEVPLASALLEGLVYNCEQIEDYPDRYKSPRELELERRARDGLPNNLSFAELSEFLDPFYRTYTCADGRGFYIVSCSIVNHPQRVLEVLGLGDLLKDLPDFDVYVDQADWPGEWALRSYPVGAGDRKRLSDAMKAAFLTRPSHEWEKLFGAAKAPATAQRSTAEWLADPHALASGLVIALDDPRHGQMRQMGNVAWLADDPGAMEKTAGPEPDSFREKLTAVLAESPRMPMGGGGKGLWLDGLKVLDLTNVIAGPTVGSTLARFGAQVTLVQPVRPSVDPWNAVVFGLHAQRGKESVLLDLRSDQGQEVLWRMVAEADVITMNGTDQKLDALGLNEARLKDINPRLILVQLDAWGGPRPGPKSDHLGYDDLAQAATGVMTRFGGGPETPEEHAHFGTIDALTGYCACVALGAALERLRKTGKGGIARASLAAAGEMIQAQFMYDFDGRAPFDEPSGRAVRGWGPFYRCYEAADGWMFFAAPTEREAALTRVADVSDLAGLKGTDLEVALADRFTQRPVADWMRAFASGSVGITPLGSLHGTRDAALQRESEGQIDISKATFRAIRHDQHPMGRWVDLIAPNAVRPEKAGITIPGPAPKYGQDTREVLARLGYEDAEVQSMIDGGAAADSWSEKYLPE